MAYRPGREPEELKKYINLLMDELRETYPDGYVDMDRWNHERWDRPAGYLMQKLGYPNGRSFLEAYGFQIYEKPAPEEEYEFPEVPQPKPRGSRRPAEQVDEPEPEDDEDETYDEEDEEEEDVPVRKRSRVGLIVSIFVIAVLLALIAAVAFVLLKGTGAASGTGARSDPGSSAHVDTAGLGTASDVLPSSGIRLSDSVSYNGINVTLRSVTEKNGSESIKPGAGKVFVYCDFEIENASASDLTVISLMNFYGYCDGENVNYSFDAIKAAPEVASLDGSITPGQKKAGVIAYEVPENWKELQIHFKNMLTGDYSFYFTATH